MNDQPPKKMALLDAMKCKRQSLPQALYDIWYNWAQSSEEALPETLKPVYIDFNTTPPSSAPVERLFSLGKRVLNPLRTSLSDQHFEACTILAFHNQKNSNK